ncbi:hypothetical protein [Chitinophaga pinensis]|uniref:Lipoprotein n=1 Tax=Chitinophaga pinensis TaxID=79329 RepID=A0A5C6LL97_9BACT|nr:hypothetical protein [Chitinophaga pinensis]TWV97353.1 hypothetical protein FEF09_22085 [Chitinophaga pinensis]
MLNSTWKSFKQPASRAIAFCGLAGIFTFTACRTNRGYDPAPRMGAEYRFEEGLKKEKNPQYLFSKKERQDLEKMGYPIGTPNQAAESGGDTKPATKSPAAGALQKAPSDSLRTDTVFKVKPQ